jgi:hypothetical protein
MQTHTFSESDIHEMSDVSTDSIENVETEEFNESLYISFSHSVTQTVYHCER